jgi:hypothetical protein
VLRNIKGYVEMNYRTRRPTRYQLGVLSASGFKVGFGVRWELEVGAIRSADYIIALPLTRIFPPPISSHKTHEMRTIEETRYLYPLYRDHLHD